MSSQGEAPEVSWVGFDWSAERYEDFIGRVVPDYEAQTLLVIEALRTVAPEGVGAFKVLELGAGTGGLARRLLDAFPGVRVSVVDVSPVMIAAIREVLAPYGERATVLQADFADVSLGSGYNAVVSRLAIHHLDDPGKQGLYARVLAALIPGGVFVNSDLIRGGSDEEEAALRADWRDYMTARGDDPDAWAGWLVGEDDHPAVEGDQIAWLEAMGFTEVRTLWKKAGFAMVCAVRPRE